MVLIPLLLSLPLVSLVLKRSGWLGTLEGKDEGESSSSSTLMCSRSTTHVVP
jgi:hypothetical protein